MVTISIQQAKDQLDILIHGLNHGEECIIMENDLPVAKLIPVTPVDKSVSIPKLGTLRGTVLSMVDFDQPLEEFSEYM